MWLYRGIQFNEEEIGDWFGFVYIITNNQTGRRYIGKKFFSRAGRKQVKGKIKKIRVSSDWLTYWGSNKTIQEDVKRLGEDKFTREILHLCKSRSECAYYESYEIFVRNALIDESFYNDWISCRIRKDHLKNIALQHKKH
jgi:hypothetical protein